MWRYELEDRGKLGERRVARTQAMVPVYIAGVLGKPTLEIIEDATWGSQVHVRLHAGQMDPRSGRRVEARVDEQDALDLPASHPQDLAEVLSLRRPRELIKAIAAGQVLYLRVPVKHQGELKMAFEVEGLDLQRLRVQAAAS